MPVTCLAGTDCEAKWGRVLAWMQEYSGYEYREWNHNLITSAGPWDGNPKRSYTIVRRDRGDGSYEIQFSSVCGNTLGCYWSAQQAKVSFVEFVMGSEATRGESEPFRSELGLVAAPVTEDLAETSGLGSQAGGYVTEVVSPGPAQRAGIQQGDIILQIGDRVIDVPSRIAAVVAVLPAGSTVEILVWRHRARVRLPLTL